MIGLAKTRDCEIFAGAEFLTFFSFPLHIITAPSRPSICSYGWTKSIDHVPNESGTWNAPEVGEQEQKHLKQLMEETNAEANGF